MNIQCGNCGAGRAYLEPIVEHLKETGEVLQTVRCILCGWRVSRPAALSARVAPEAPARRTLHSEAAAEARRRVVEEGTRVCSVVGCRSTYFAPTSRNPLCKEHRRRLATWAYNLRLGRRLALPVARVNGHWIERGQPLPAIA